MNTRIVAALFALLVLSPIPPAAAHHSAAQFDLTIRDRTWTGVIKEFKAMNPHSHVVIEVSDDKGTREIAFEGSSLANMFRAGWRPGDLNVGDMVTINAAPRKDGGDGGFVLSITTTDGRKY
jgi:Family of unknown function (DUF6152)